MPGIEVFAVEVKRFRGEGAQTLVPRVFGSTAPPRSGARPPRLTRELFLEDFAVEAQRQTAGRLLDAAVSAGATLRWTPNGVVVRVVCPLRPRPVTVAWLYVPSKAGVVWMKTRDFTFGAAILDEALDERLRGVLERWAERFERDPFADASSDGVRARSIDYSAAVGEVERLVAGLTSVISEIRALPAG